MSSVHDEGDLQFAFDDGWNVLKWDAHGAYIDGLQRFSGTKAVDFFGLYLGAPWFIEVKDFRGHRIANKDRLKSGELAREIAEKVRDTIAGMVWACNRAPLDAGQVSKFVEPILDRSAKLFVVLWLEEDRPADPAAASMLQEKIRRELSWLNPRVLVANRSLSDKKPIQGLVVKSLGIAGSS